MVVTPANTNTRCRHLRHKTFSHLIDLSHRIDRFLIAHSASTIKKYAHSAHFAPPTSSCHGRVFKQSSTLRHTFKVPLHTSNKAFRKQAMLR